MGTGLNCRYLTSWVGGSAQATLFVSCLQSQGCVGTPGCFFSAHTELKASGPWGDILWVWQKVFWIIIVDYTFKLSIYNLSIIMEFNKTKLYRKQFTSSALQISVVVWEAQCVIQAFIVLFSECNLKPPSGGSQAEWRDEVTPSCDIIVFTWQLCSGSRKQFSHIKGWITEKSCTLFLPSPKVSITVRGRLNIWPLMSFQQQVGCLQAFIWKLCWPGAVIY